MSGEPLSFSNKRRGRRTFYVFAVFNAFSFLLLSGNLVTLYLIRLGATPSVIGIASAFLYISFFFMIPGKAWVRRVGVVKTFGLGWLLRYLAMGPVLVTPVFLVGPSAIPIVLAMVGVAGFNIFRGVGIVGQSPVLNALSSGRDRGTFLSGFAILIQTVSIVTSVAIALFVGPEAPTTRYIVIFAVGLAFGLGATALIFALPEPANAKESASTGLLEGVRKTFEDKNTRRFLLAFGAYSFVLGMVRPFLIVYIKEVFFVTDGVAMLFTVVANLGAILMGLIAQVVLDRLGAKPLILIFISVFFVSLVAVAAIPQVAPPVLYFFVGALFFVSAFGSTGGENASQSYFYSLVRPDQAVNMGIVYFVTLGIGGSLGSPVAGFVIDFLSSNTGLAVGDVYRVFFAVGAVLLLVVILSMSRINRLGSVSVRSALSVIFSVRDLRAINLVQRLDKTGGIHEERTVLRRLKKTGAEISVDDVLYRLESPSYLIRLEALGTLQAMPVTTAMTKALMRVVKTQVFTTAHFAARILGDRGVTEAKHLLRETLRSEDYLLAGESVLSLAKLGDKASIKEIELLLKVSENPRLLLHSVVALRILESVASTPVLLDLLSRQQMDSYLGEEIIVSLSGVLGIEGRFFPLYRRFLSDEQEGLEHLDSEADRLGAEGAAAFVGLCRRIIDGDNTARRMIAAVLDERVSGILPSKAVHAIAEACRDGSLLDRPRFAFFCVAAAVLAERDGGDSRKDGETRSVSG